MSADERVLTVHGRVRAFLCSYRLDHVRTLCERYHITDALSWLLERMGDIPGAMRLLLQALNEHVAKTFAGVCTPCLLVRTPAKRVLKTRPRPALCRSLSLSPPSVSHQAHDSDRNLEKALREMVLVVRTAAQLAHRNSARMDAKLGYVQR